jgi:ADP-heptose:LPS heptosyltransferase
LRTTLLRTFFFLSGVPIKTFAKGRGEKGKFTRKEKKITIPLPHTVERYQQAFIEAGFVFPLLSGPHLNSSPNTINFVQQWLVENKLSKSTVWIGIAPFAMHKSKIWPVENYKELFQLLLKQHAYQFFLFGGGKAEIDFFNSLVSEFPNNTTLVAGVLKLDKELALMQQLDIMLCVDSSNMHLATLVGAPVLSIWGGTHPQVGFGPFQRDGESIVQISREELPCRPCSVYGKETCHRGDFACMNWITPELIAQRITTSLNRTS